MTLRSLRAVVAALCLALTGIVAVPLTAHATPVSRRAASNLAAQLDVTSLQTAAAAVESQALASGAMRHAPTVTSPAKVLLASVDALLAAARRADPSLQPTDTTSLMGKVPASLRFTVTRPLSHQHITATHTFDRFHRALADAGSAGIGRASMHGHSQSALLQIPDGAYVDPHLPQTVAHPTVAMVALRTAMKVLGQPYVWAAGGPITFDCSGLVQWAYAHAGVALGHYTGYQWNEGRRISPSSILPGDLVLFGNPTYHVGMYLGAGWMINAPYTGQYVNVVPVHGHVAGVIRP